MVTNTVVTEVTQPAGLNNAAAPQASLQLVPNPNHGIFEVRAQELSAQSVTFMVFDLYGREVLHLSEPAFTGSLPIDVQELAGGCYIVQIHIGNQTASQKLVLMR